MRNPFKRLRSLLSTEVPAPTQRKLDPAGVLGDTSLRKKADEYTRAAKTPGFFSMAFGGDPKISQTEATFEEGPTRRAADEEDEDRMSRRGPRRNRSLLRP